MKSAEAEAEAKYLSGVGVAKQRKAIVDGLKSSIVVSCLSYSLTIMYCSIVAFVIFEMNSVLHTCCL